MACKGVKVWNSATSDRRTIQKDKPVGGMLKGLTRIRLLGFAFKYIINF